MQSISEAAIEGAWVVDAGLYGPLTQGHLASGCLHRAFCRSAGTFALRGGGPPRGLIPSILNVVMRPR